MSYFTIYFIGLTVVFAIYYVAMIVLDLKATNAEKSDVETIEVPEPAPDEPPTDVEETKDGYVIKNQKGSNGTTTQTNVNGNASHGGKADDVISQIGCKV